MTEYEVIVNHRSDLLTQDLVLKGVFLHCKLKKFGLSFDFPFIRYDHSNGDILWPADQIEAFRNAKLSEDDFKRLIALIEKEKQEYTQYLEKFKEKIESGTDKEKTALEYFERSLRMTPAIVYFVFGESLPPLLEKQNIPVHAIPSAVTDTTRASLELERIAREHAAELKTPPKMSDKLKQDLAQFCARFGYLGMKYFQGVPWTVQEAYGMLSSIPEKKTDKQTKQYNSPYLDFAAQLLRLRTEKWEAMCYGAFLFREFIIRNFSDKFEYNSLLNLRVDEVLDLIQGRGLPKDIAARRKAFILEIREDGVHFASEERKKEEQVSQKNVQELAGICAQPGKVTGKVRIVLTPKECAKVEVGDILVATMSTPDFLPAMRRAAAFVTDIGGITSHAAIVAREMKKPCVIGTKIATKVFKDGDKVEVDADKGTIKKIS